MRTVELIESDVSWMCPVTHLYKTQAGHLLVCVRDRAMIVELAQDLGVPIFPSHVPLGVDAFLADERGQVVDYDGNPANGLTPILSTDSRSFAMTIDPDLRTHEDALEALGYTLTKEN